MLQATITITLKAGVLDPQGKAIEKSLQHLGFEGISHVGQGKVIRLTLNETDTLRAKATIDQLCKALLVNQITEDYRLHLEPLSA